jgi:histidine ammonia-lyase
VLADALPFVRQFIETELNSTNDNPLIDPVYGDALHGGNFYGGHIAFAMDSLKNAVANCADLFDRQIALLVNERSNNGLPSNLVGRTDAASVISHGFKAVHIGTSAWAAEALKESVPASVFSRSTESHNQDKVSMGTIAARDCIRILTLTEQTMAATMLAAAQGLDLRMKNGLIKFDDLSDPVKALYKYIRSRSEFVKEDRPLEHDLRLILSDIQNGTIPV